VANSKLAYSSCATHFGWVQERSSPMTACRS